MFRDLICVRYNVQNDLTLQVVGAVSGKGAVVDTLGAVLGTWAGPYPAFASAQNTDLLHHLRYVTEVWLFGSARGNCKLNVES